jgi:hypothetical protein
VLYRDIWRCGVSKHDGVCLSGSALSYLFIIYIVILPLCLKTIQTCRISLNITPLSRISFAKYITVQFSKKGNKVTLYISMTYPPTQEYTIVQHAPSHRTFTYDLTQSIAVMSAVMKSTIATDFCITYVINRRSDTWLMCNIQISFLNRGFVIINGFQ